jgi:hypothetical protein
VELVESREEILVFLGATVQVICPLLEAVTAQLLPSMVTVLLAGLAENPLPLIVRYCPPMLPVTGLIELMVGRAEN